METKEEMMDQQDTDEEEISVAAPVHNEHLVLGSKYSVKLVVHERSDDEAEGGGWVDGEDIPLFLARLPVSTTLTELEINFESYDIAHRDNLRIVQPICECLANLQREHHPLRKLALTDMDEDDAQPVFIDALQRLLIAAKQFGIKHLSLEDSYCIPVESLVEFGNNNHHLNVLELQRLNFIHNVGERELHPLAVLIPRWPWKSLFQSTSALQIVPLHPILPI